MIDCRHNHEFMRREREVFLTLTNGNHQRVAEMIIQKPQIAIEYRRFYCNYICGDKCKTTGGERRYQATPQ